MYYYNQQQQQQPQFPYNYNTQPPPQQQPQPQFPYNYNTQPPPPQQLQQQVWEPQPEVTRMRQCIIDQVTRTRSLYEDNEFPPTAKSLGKNISSGVVWKRPTEFVSNPQLFIDGTSEGDVIQGNLGDCWFLGALAVVATRIDLIKEIVVSSFPQYGFYQFRFYKNGEWQVVTIDDKIPCKGSDSKYQPIFAHCKDENEMWVPLIEKAYAKLHGSYQSLESGYTTEGFTDLTGGVGEILNIKSLSDGSYNSLGGLWGIIGRCLQESWLMGASASGGQEVDNGLGLLTGHAYSIMDARTLPNNNIKLVKLRNPWGKKEWVGDWSDKSNKWTPQLLSFCNHSRDSNDGTFWMSFSDFIKNFTHFHVCKLYSDSIGEKYFRYLFKGEWRGSTAGGCSNHNTWRQNPQYGLVVYQECNVLFSLSQEDVRMLNPTRDEYAIGFQIFRTTDVNTRLTTASKDSLILKSGNFSYYREVSIESMMKPGCYIIVPSTFEPGLNAKFVLILYSSKQISLTHLKSTGEVEVTHGNPMQEKDQIVFETPAPRQPRYMDPYYDAQYPYQPPPAQTYPYPAPPAHQANLPPQQYPPPYHVPPQNHSNVPSLSYDHGGYSTAQPPYLPPSYGYPTSSPGYPSSPSLDYITPPSYHPPPTTCAPPPYGGTYPPPPVGGGAYPPPPGVGGAYLPPPGAPGYAMPPPQGGFAPPGSFGQPPQPGGGFYPPYGSGPPMYGGYY